MTTSSDSHQPAAIVTAGDSGIGRATAVALSADGFTVGITWHLDEDGARQTADEIAGGGGRCEVEHMDLTAGPHAATAVDRLADRLGGVDVLVNNAGTGDSTAFTELSFENWRAVLAVDLDGAFLCSQRAVRRMVAAGRAAAS